MQGRGWSPQARAGSALVPPVGQLVACAVQCVGVCDVALSPGPSCKGLWFVSCHCQVACLAGMVNVHPLLSEAPKEACGWQVKSWAPLSWPQPALALLFCPDSVWHLLRQWAAAAGWKRTVHLARVAGLAFQAAVKCHCRCCHRRHLLELPPVQCPELGAKGHGREGPAGHSVFPGMASVGVRSPGQVGTFWLAFPSSLLFPQDSCTLPASLALAQLPPLSEIHWGPCTVPTLGLM